MDNCGMDAYRYISFTLTDLFFSSDVLVFVYFFCLKSFCLLTFSLLYFFDFPGVKYIALSTALQ